MLQCHRTEILRLWTLEHLLAFKLTNVHQIRKIKIGFIRWFSSRGDWIASSDWLLSGLQIVCGLLRALGRLTSVFAVRSCCRIAQMFTTKEMAWFRHVQRTMLSAHVQWWCVYVFTSWAQLYCSLFGLKKWKLFFLFSSPNKPNIKSFVTTRQWCLPQLQQDKKQLSLQLSASNWFLSCFSFSNISCVLASKNLSYVQFGHNIHRFHLSCGVT